MRDILYDKHTFVYLLNSNPLDNISGVDNKIKSTKIQGNEQYHLILDNCCKGDSKKFKIREGS